MNDSFFAFLKLLINTFLIEKDKEFFIYLLYGPALTVRKRAIDSKRLIRSLEFLSFFDSRNKESKIFKSFSKLYEKSFLDTLSIDSYF